MLSKHMFRLFHFYFTSAHFLGFFPFKWNQKGGYFYKINEAKWHLQLWKCNTFVLSIKIAFLATQVLKLRNDLPKLVFENLFLISYLIAVIHNVIFWRTRESFPVLYWRCKTFSKIAKGKPKIPSMLVVSIMSN